MFNVYPPNPKLVGELYCRTDEGHHGLQVQHKEHVRHCPCRSWQIYFD